MKRFYSAAPVESRPRVLALTASPLSGKSPNSNGWQPASEEDMKSELAELEEKVDCRTWTELGLVESQMLKITVEERHFDQATTPTSRQVELLEMIRSAKIPEMNVTDGKRLEAFRRWNRALRRVEDEESGIAKELGEWAALQGLQLLCKGQAADVFLEDEEDQSEEAKEDKVEGPEGGEEEDQLCQAKDRLQRMLSSWQRKHLGKIHSSKVYACIDKLKERFKADGGDMKCIVFTRTRAVCQLLAAILDDEKLPPVTYVVGGNECKVSGWRIRQSASSQKQALANFARSHREEGAVSIVVATSVLAEGIDVPSCGLVLCFDPPVSPLQHVQLRGRARRAESEFTVLTSVSGEAPLSAGPSLQQLKDYEVRVLHVLSTWNLRPMRKNTGSIYTADEVLEIAASGARLPMERAKNHLHTMIYGNLISTENRSEREILDFCKPGFRDNERKYGYSMFKVFEVEHGWCCELELPPVGCCSKTLEEQTTAVGQLSYEWWKKKKTPICKEHLGMVMGRVVATKGEAKDAAALRACQVLHELGILDDHLNVLGRADFRELIKKATGAGGRTTSKRRSDDAIALASIETLERKLPACFLVPENPMQFHIHRLQLKDYPGKHGLALLLPEEVPSGCVQFLLLPPGQEDPMQVEVESVASIEFSQEELDNLKVWTQMCLELSCRERTIPLHPIFSQRNLTAFKDRSGRWVPSPNPQISEDEDLPERSYWLLAPLADTEVIHWDFVNWGLTSLYQFLQSESWQTVSTCFGSDKKKLHHGMAISDAVAVGQMPTTSRGSDVCCLCVDLELQDGDVIKGYKFSRALVNAGVAPDFTRAERNLHEEGIEIQLQADELELIPLSVKQLHVLRLLPSLLWRLEFVALMQELPKRCDGLLTGTTPAALGEALTHSQVLSMPFELPAYRFCLERLELLGDAALKLMASVHCGACMPRASEGELSSSAQFFETNKWLRHVSKQTLDLPSYILLYAFRTKERLARLRRDGAPQKVLADAMEALLGAAFRCAASQGPASLSQGMAETWRIFGTLLKNSPVDSNVNTAVSEPFIPDFKTAVQAALSSRAATQQDPEMDQRCVEMVEQAMGYRFRNPKLLAALRAKPCGTRSTAFERLEFLGDAVLQVMANWHVMQEFSDFDEGELSDTQQALVSNHYISRKLVRRFDKDGLISVFFPGSNSPLQRHVMKFLTATTHEDTDFLVGDKTDIMAKGTRTSGAQNSEFKFIADAYEALIAAVLLDTGCDLDQTWSVFAPDFDMSNVNVKEKISLWRQRLRDAEKMEVIESGALLPQSQASQASQAGGQGGALREVDTATKEISTPVFGQMTKGEARKNLMEYCKRHNVKMKFEGSKDSEVFRWRAIVDGTKYPEAEASSSGAAQDLASEMALWHIQHPPPKVSTYTSATASGSLEDMPLADADQPQVMERPKGVARKELQKFCNARLQGFRFVDREVIQKDNSKIFHMSVQIGDRAFPEGSASTKPAAQDMAAELALLELRGLADISNHPDAVIPDRVDPPLPLPQQEVSPPTETRPKGVDRQELQSICQRQGYTLSWKEEEDGPSHLRTFKVSAIVQGVVYPEAKANTKNGAKDLAAFLALQGIKQ